MSSGGMDWAYRIIAAHDLDPLGVAIVLHLGWRDAPSFRTDSGIARALGQHRSSVRGATAKLVALGVIVRRSGQWVASETVAIVEEKPCAPRPDPASADPVDWPVSGQPDIGSKAGQSVATPRPLTGQPNGQSVATMRKENKEKGAARRFSRSSRPRPLPSPATGQASAGAGSVERGKLLSFYGELVRDPAKLCPASMIGPQLARDLLASGEVTQAQLRERGISA